ncbi:MAG: hypothetical protein M0Z46_06570 [Actinomycetota bacterium]|nr:hypothetical protein [Actinomycetota bacterium]MDA8358962.1 hypothetical protein [Actinomycetota bacterium]
MTGAERVAFALAERFPELDAAAMSEHPAFGQTLAAALAVTDERAIVEQVIAQGGLAGARNPQSVVVGRLRRLPGLARTRSAVDVEIAAERALDAPEARMLRDAANRGALLGLQVRRGALSREDALVQLDWDFRGSAEQLGAALAAFDGGTQAPAPAFDLHLDAVESSGGLR